VDQPDPKFSIEQTMHEIAKFHFILEEGRKGNHLLFHPEAIREAFARDQAELLRLFQEKINEINQALNHTFSLASFEEKREYIRLLPADVRDALIFGYFQLLEGNAGEPEERVLH
jgi:hypothetical protein